MFENDFLAFDGSPADVGKLVRDHGLEITLFQPFRDFEGMPEPLRSRTFDRAERKFDVMQQLGTDLVLVCSNVSPAAIGGIDRAAADFHELGERAARRGLEGGLRGACLGPPYQRPPRRLGDRPSRRSSECRSYPRQLPHFVAQDRRQFDPLDSQGEDLHRPASDAPLIDMDLLYWSRHFRNMPGEGDLPVTAVYRSRRGDGL
ncbi:sugar phosphate isomerase/epimerase family protein [Rhizobium beringeri]